MRYSPLALEQVLDEVIARHQAALLPQAEQALDWQPLGIKEAAQCIADAQHLRASYPFAQHA